MDDFFEDDPLDLDGDGDHTIEMCMLFDDDETKQRGSRPPGGGCLGLLFILCVPGVVTLLRPWLV